MPSLLVRDPSGDRRLEIGAGQSVRDALDMTDLRVRAACGGTGACGACGVQVISGEVNPLTATEYLRLAPDERARGMRLACQLRPVGDVAIRIDDPAPPSRWTSIAAEDLTPIVAANPQLESDIYGVAVDLGTTHIRLALWDRKRGQRIATRRGPNPQYAFGADVLNRLSAAAARPERGEELARLARTAVVQALRDILARDVGEVTPMLARIGRVLIVGNTAMLALLTGRGGDVLLRPESWQMAVDCSPPDAEAWHAHWFMPNAEVIVAPPVAGFVGSDLTADLIATGLAEGPPASMLVDIGTNTEIALWDGRRIHVTSVPGGPAFEAVGIRHGMAAERGAIWRIRRQAAAAAFDVIDGVAPRGFCGSGLVDAIALLLADGRLKPSGRFAVAVAAEGLRLDPAEASTAIVPGDVDAFQRAKAAMAAAMAELLHIAGVDWSDVNRLCVCGAFGRRLDIGHAQAVGLLPGIDPAVIELDADATLAGCERALLAADGLAPFADLSGRILTHNLSFVAGYEDRFIDHLRLRPIASTHAAAAKRA